MTDVAKLAEEMLAADAAGEVRLSDEGREVFRALAAIPARDVDLLIQDVEEEIRLHPDKYEDDDR